VQHVAVWHEQEGKRHDEIVAEHYGLTLTDVYATLAYDYDHREKIAADIEKDAAYRLRGGDRESRPDCCNDCRLDEASNPLSSR
jgi:hypothetical protein